MLSISDRFGLNSAARSKNQLEPQERELDELEKLLQNKN